jgi:adenylosuccinate synthase
MTTSIVVDLGFGDAGKGTIVDALARRCSTPPLVVRFNGGAQAGHNVHTSDGRHHTFSQFGAGMFVPGSRTLLSKFMILHPTGLLEESFHLESLGVSEPLQRLLVDRRALVVSPYQQAANRIREFARGKDRHGTCGLGIGETVGDSLDHPDFRIRVGDLREVEPLRYKLHSLRKLKLEQMEPLFEKVEGISEVKYDVQFLRSEYIDQTVLYYLDAGSKLRIIEEDEVEFQIRESENVIFEGAQGVLLDEWRGFHPHTTWSTTTTENALRLIAAAGRKGPVREIGVVRAYATRHGQGPFPTEDASLTAQLRETTNSDIGWQGEFRVGWFDALLTDYAIGLCPGSTGPGLTELAVTCLDRVRDFPRVKMCVGYESGDEGLFELDVRGLVVGIRKGPERDLQYQERLGEALRSMKPRWIESTPDQLLRTIYALFGVPVTIGSYGPTAEDKRWFEGCE